LAAKPEPSLQVQILAVNPAA